MKTSPETILALASRTATFIGSIDPGQEEVQGAIKDSHHPYWAAIKEVFAKPVPPSKAPVVVAQIPPPPPPPITILHETPKPCAKRTVDEQITGMKMLYNQLGWQFTQSGLAIPERRQGFDRLIVMSDTTLTNNRVYDACKASFPCWKYTGDLDTSIPSNNDERHPSRGIYAVWFRDRIEADEELKNLSANMIKERGLKCILFTCQTYLW